MCLSYLRQVQLHRKNTSTSTLCQVCSPCTRVGTSQTPFVSPDGVECNSEPYSPAKLEEVGMPLSTTFSRGSSVANTIGCHHVPRLFQEPSCVAKRNRLKSHRIRWILRSIPSVGPDFCQTQHPVFNYSSNLKGRVPAHLFPHKMRPYHKELEYHQEQTKNTRELGS